MELERAYDEGSKDNLWLAEDELFEICDYHEPCSDRWIAINLMARSGLKVYELIEITQRDIDVSDDPMVHLTGSVSSGKPHLTPIPKHVAYAILALDVEGPVINISDRGIRRWVNEMAEDLARKHGNRNWEVLSPRHIRNSWVMNLLRSGVPPATVMEWTGHQHYNTFQDLYLDRIESSLIHEEREKSDLL